MKKAKKQEILTMLHNVRNRILDVKEKNVDNEIDTLAKLNYLEICTIIEMIG